MDPRTGWWAIGVRIRTPVPIRTSRPVPRGERGGHCWALCGGGDAGSTWCTDRTFGPDCVPAPPHGAGCQLWSIFWISERDRTLQPPVHGGFAGSVGEFEGRDVDGGRLVHVKFVWDRSDPQAPRWRQSFSYDEGATWELNWLMEFQR